MALDTPAKPRGKFKKPQTGPDEKWFKKHDVGGRTLNISIDNEVYIDWPCRIVIFVNFILLIIEIIFVINIIINYFKSKKENKNKKKKSSIKEKAWKIISTLCISSCIIILMWLHITAITGFYNTCSIEDRGVFRLEVYITLIQEFIRFIIDMVLSVIISQ